MKKATNKLMSFLAAFAMVIGVLVAPFTSANAAKVEAPDGKIATTTGDMPTSTKVNVWKLQADSYNAPQQWNHNGGTLTKEQLGKLGKNVRGLKGVEFSYWKVSAAELDKLNTSKPDTVEKVNDLLNRDKVDGKTELTDENGKAEILDLANGNYWFVESKTPANVTTNGGHAVPFALTLPQVKLVKGEDGKFAPAKPTEYLTEVNVYPKNTTTKVDVNKDFTDEIDNDRDDETKDADIRDYRLGDAVPYTVRTVFKAKTNYENAYWTDEMTDGLTFTEENKNDLKVKINNEPAKEGDYTLTVTKDAESGIQNGFRVELTEAGLAKVSDKDEDVTVDLVYKATVNSKSVVNIPETNDVTFIYGNDQRFGNTPQPTFPDDDKKLTVSKSFLDVEGQDKDPKPGESITFDLFDAQDGKSIGTVKFTQNDDGTYTVNDGTGDKTVQGNEWTYTWENLDLERQYKVVERDLKGFQAQYTSEKGKTVVVNKVSDNTTVNPKEPHIVHYGKKFVKADEATGDRLEGAVFAVKNANTDEQRDVAHKGEYLVYKSDSDKEADRAAYLEVKAAYDEMTKEGSTTSQEEADKYYKDNVVPKYNALKTRYDWKAVDLENEDAVKELVKLTSDSQGRFAIDGLAEGNYELVELEAPKGYSIPTNNAHAFAVNAESWTKEDGVQFTPADDAENTSVDKTTGDAQRVNNKNVTIPQTGGIGSLIFIVAGLALMGVAFVAMKRRNSYEEA